MPKTLLADEEFDRATEATLAAQKVTSAKTASDAWCWGATSAAGTPLASARAPPRLIDEWGDVLDRLGTVRPGREPGSRGPSRSVSRTEGGLVRDVGLLDSASASARARSSAFGEDAYPSLALKALGGVHG